MLSFLGIRRRLHIDTVPKMKFIPYNSNSLHL